MYLRACGEFLTDDVYLKLYGRFFFYSKASRQTQSFVTCMTYTDNDMVTDGVQNISSKNLLQSQCLSLHVQLTKSRSEGSRF